MVVRVWAMASPLPNSFFCCYGYYKEKNERINYDTIINTITFNQQCQKNTHNLQPPDVDSVLRVNKDKCADNAAYAHTHTSIGRSNTPVCKYKNTGTHALCGMFG